MKYQELNKSLSTHLPKISLIVCSITFYNEFYKYPNIAKLFAIINYVKIKTIISWCIFCEKWVCLFEYWVSLLLRVVWELLVLCLRALLQIFMSGQLRTNKSDSSIKVYKIYSGKINFFHCKLCPPIIKSVVRKIDTAIYDMLQAINEYVLKSRMFFY